MGWMRGKEEQIGKGNEKARETGMEEKQREANAIKMTEASVSEKMNRRAREVIEETARAKFEGSASAHHPARGVAAQPGESRDCPATMQRSAHATVRTPRPSIPYGHHRRHARTLKVWTIDVQACGAAPGRSGSAREHCDGSAQQTGDGTYRPAKHSTR